VLNLRSWQSSKPDDASFQYFPAHGLTIET
jgi:hypothetical protein